MDTETFQWRIENCGNDGVVAVSHKAICESASQVRNQMMEKHGEDNVRKEGMSTHLSEKLKKPVSSNFRTGMCR